MVPVSTTAVDDNNEIIIKRPTPYSLPPKPNWWLNGHSSMDKLISKVQTTKKTIPVPLPRMNSSSSNESAPKTPVPLPRTKFNVITTDPVPLERSVSVPSSKPRENSDEKANKLTHSMSDPSDCRHSKIDSTALPPVAELNITKSLEEAVVDFTTAEEDDGDTWL